MKSSTEDILQLLENIHFHSAERKESSGEGQVRSLPHWTGHACLHRPLEESNSLSLDLLWGNLPSCVSWFLVFEALGPIFSVTQHPSISDLKLLANAALPPLPFILFVPELLCMAGCVCVRERQRVGRPILLSRQALLGWWLTCSLPDDPLTLLALSSLRSFFSSFEDSLFSSYHSM